MDKEKKKIPTEEKESCIDEMGLCKECWIAMGYPGCCDACYGCIFNSDTFC